MEMQMEMQNTAKMEMQHQMRRQVAQNAAEMRQMEQQMEQMHLEKAEMRSAFQAAFDKTVGQVVDLTEQLLSVDLATEGSSALADRVSDYMLSTWHIFEGLRLFQEQFSGLSGWVAQYGQMRYVKRQMRDRVEQWLVEHRTTIDLLTSEMPSVSRAKFNAFRTYIHSNFDSLPSLSETLSQPFTF